MIVKFRRKISDGAHHSIKFYINDESGEEIDFSVDQTATKDIPNKSISFQSILVGQVDDSIEIFLTVEDTETLLFKQTIDLDDDTTRIVAGGLYESVFVSAVPF